MKLNILSAIAFRGTQALAWLVFARIVILEYGSDKFGLIAVMLSVFSWLQLVDFGIASYLKTRLPQMVVEGKTDRDLINLTASGLWRTFRVFAVFFVVFASIFYTFDAVVPLIEKALNVEAKMSDYSTGLFFLVLLAGCFLQIISQFVLAFTGAHFQQYRFYGLAILGCILQVGCAFISVQQGYDLFYTFCLFILTGPLLNVLYLLERVLRLSNGAKNECIKTSQSNDYFILQLGGAVLYNTDVIFMAAFFSLEEAGIYGVLKQVVQAFLSAHSVILQQSWPYLSQKHRLGEIPLIQKCFQKNIWLTGALAVISLVSFVAIVPPLFDFWTEGKYGPVELSYYLALAAFSASFMFGNIYSIGLLAFGEIRLIKKVVLCELPLSFFLVFIFKDLIGVYSVIGVGIFNGLVGFTVTYLTVRHVLMNIDLQQGKANA